MSLFQPEKYVSRITHIDIQEDLLNKGFTTVLLDMDNTIKARYTHTVPDDVAQWLNDARQLGIRFCILSNNWHQSAYDQADELGYPVVAKACKPLIHGYAMACKKMNSTRKNTLMIGDQLFTDVVGAHLYGMNCIMVGPLSEVDLKHTLAIRKIEYALIGDKIRNNS